MLNDQATALSSNLCEMSTHVVDFKDANRDDDPDRVRAAYARIYERYRKAIYRYLCGILRDADVAELLLSDFADRLVSGRYKNFRPEDGRFRDYLRRSLGNMVSDHRRTAGRGPASITDASLIEDRRSIPHEEDDRFLAHWRAWMLLRAWSELMVLEGRSGRPFATILWESFPNDARAVLGGPTSHDLWGLLGLTSLPGSRTSAQIAESFAERGLKPDTEEGVRSVRKEARDALKDFLLNEVWTSLDSPSAEKVEAELIELGLLDGLQSAVKRRKQGVHRKASR